MKILVLEDELTLGEDLCKRLQDFGYEVTGLVKSYDEAIRSVKKNPPDLAICDIKIYGYRNGITTARAIKEIKPIPIIYLTAFFDDKLVEEALDTEPSNYLLKPINIDQLLTSIKLALADAQEVEFDLSNPTEFSPVVKDDCYLKIQGIYQRIHIPDIYYFQADGVKTHLKTERQSFLIKDKTLKATLEAFKHPDILRISASIAINKNKIIEIDGRCTTLILQKPNRKTKDEYETLFRITDSHKEKVKKYLEIG